MECPDHLVEYLEQSAGSIYDNTGYIQQPETVRGQDAEDREIVQSLKRFSMKENGSPTTPSPHVLTKQSGSIDFLKEHEEDIMAYYQKELSRWQMKYRALEEKYQMVVSRLSEIENDQYP
jgi:hypothetical protein